jgi:hypothetical protein
LHQKAFGGVRVTCINGFIAFDDLLSNPEEFQKALQERPPRGATTLAQWNEEEYDAEASVDTCGDTVPF